MTVRRVEELLNTAEMMVGLYENPMEAAILASAVVAAVERRTQTRLPWMRIIDEFHACMRQGVYRLGQ